MEPLSREQLASRLETRRLTVGADKAAALAAFINLLEQWNRVHNLTGIRDRARLIDRHLVESLALEPLILGSEVADIGSGGGLPGVPLAIALPEVRFTLIESRRKRVSFLRHAAASLGLDNVRVAHGRAESLDLPVFETVLARAVAPPQELLAIATPLVAGAGRLILLTSAIKGREILALATGFTAVSAESEVSDLESAIVVLERKLS